MTTKEVRSLIEWARENGVMELKVGEIEVKFAQPAQVVDTADYTEELKRRMEEEPDMLYYASS